MIAYAAFVMTYRRQELLFTTIQKLKQQTFPPAQILVVDNCAEGSAKEVAEKLDCDHFVVGYNSGPAGAAYWGLKILFDKGWEWVLWVDDDDPPVFDDVLENVFTIADKATAPESIGILGTVGVKFNRQKAKLERIPDKELTGVLEVDNIAGNMFPVVHKRVYESNILPDKDLFFGFEELDFNLSVQRAGYKILVSGEEIARHRLFWGRTNMHKNKYTQKSLQKLWREYYSVRNMLCILLRKEKAIGATILFTARSIVKSIAGFRYGIAYGKQNGKYVLKGLADGLRNKMGAVIATGAHKKSTPTKIISL